jgi:hypothetical protein
MVAAMDADPYACIATCNARVFGAVAIESEVVQAGQNRTATGTLADLLCGRLNIYIGSTSAAPTSKRSAGSILQ